MTDLVWYVIVAVLILTLPTLGFILCSVLSAGKIEDAWEEGYQAARKDLYVTKTGRVMTDAEIEILSDEAEEGYMERGYDA